jgi:hypothetical protein
MAASSNLDLVRSLRGVSRKDAVLYDRCQEVMFTDSRATTSASTAGGRTAAERIAVRWPGVAHLTTASVLRLPSGSRLRRTLLERAAHVAYEAWNRDDYREGARAIADPEIEVHLEQGAELPVGLDDFYRGRVEIEDVVEVAPNKVLITGRHIGEGLMSGAEIERWGAVLYTFRRGKILRVDGFLFSDKESVSEAVRSLVRDGQRASARSGGQTARSPG